MIDATREQVWAVLVDPDMIAKLTPLVRSITDDGDGHWRWQLGGIDVLGASMAPSFTVRMDFTPQEHIDFSPAPRAGRSERAAVTGWYDLTEPPAGQSGIQLATSLEITLDLPLPGLTRAPVEASMRRVIDGMGTAFSKNLLDQLAETG